MKLAALFNQENALPTAPKVIQELIDSFGDENLSTDQLAKKIAVEPSLSANLLRLANSAYYRVSRQISSVEAAVAMLGFVTVRTLVITCSLVTRFKSTPGIDLKQFWRYSLSTAAAGKWLARECGHDGELAFTIGIMHGLGELMMHLGMPEESMTLDKIAHPFHADRLRIEKDVFGFNYSDVTAELAERWRFPPDIVAALRGYGRSLEADNFNPQSAILQLATWLARAEENHLSAEQMRAGFPERVAGLLGYTAEQLLDEIPSPHELRAGLEDLIP